MSVFLLAVTLIKLLVAACWGGTNDIPQTLEQARAFLAGRDILSPEQTGGNPAFFPLGHYLIASVAFVASQWTHVPFSLLIKVPAILADLAVSVVLGVRPRGGPRAAFLYMVNPVTFLLSVYHGQLHTVAVAGAVAALWVAAKGQSRLSGFLLGLAASVRQHFGLLLIPLLFRPGRARVTLLASFAVTVFVLNVWLLQSAHPAQLLSPTWIYGSWGYGLLLRQGPRVLSLFGITGLEAVVEGVNLALLRYGFLIHWVWAGAFLLWYRQRSRAGNAPEPWQGSLFFLVGLYALSPGLAVQWLVWALPFWLIVNRRDAMWYSVLAGLFLAGSYWQWTLNQKYGLDSITANLTHLTPVDLTGVILVGTIGLLTWGYCARAAWRLATGR